MADATGFGVGFQAAVPYYYFSNALNRFTFRAKPDMSDNELLEFIEIEPQQTATASVIILHGLGADGHDFEQVVELVTLPATLSVRFIMPHAPMRSVTINGGEQMRAWYDFVPHSEHAGEDDIRVSAASVAHLIERERQRGIPASRIVLAGFSQGGVVALHTALRYSQRLAGVIAMSTYLDDVRTTEAERSDANLALPILMMHGTRDAMIPIMRAATARENLIRLGYDVRWFDYPMEHQVCMEEIEEFSLFLAEVLS